MGIAGSSAANSKIPVAILGATGAVGQRLVSLLGNHPWFEVTALAASDRSVGKPYERAVRWFLEEPLPQWAAGMPVVPCQPGLDARIVFSGLDASVAGSIEENFAKSGYAVVSNSRNHRMVSDVPLVVPEVNSEHLRLIELQRERFRRGGFIVTNPNCSTVGLVMALAPLHRAFGLENVVVATMQAVSGAGYPGVSSVDILDNVIPYIAGEEEKMESETLKILGEPGAAARFPVSAHCHRVHVSDGHTLAISMGFHRTVQIDEVIKVLRSFESPLRGEDLPSLPVRPLIVRDENDRPQPRFDRGAGKGMVVSVGRVRPCATLDVKMVALVHNTIRGAAGAALLNAELLRARGYVEDA